MSNAIYTVKVGKGWGITEYPVIDIALVGGGTSWHIFRQGGVAGYLCGASGAAAKQIHEVDAKVVRIDGHPVCARCSSLLGHVSIPDPVGRPSN